MTEPDVFRQSRNVLLVLAPLLLLGSFYAALDMHWWLQPIDYWLLYAAIVGFIAAVASAAASLGLHFAYLDALRSN